MIMSILTPVKGHGTNLTTRITSLTQEFRPVQRQFPTQSTSKTIFQIVDAVSQVDIRWICVALL